MSHVSISKTATAATLKDRAAMLARCRNFFSKRGVLEVDVPILSYASSVDLFIDPVEARCCGQLAYLHTSPEYGMKRLLAENIGDIYQISHVFRDYEKGERHTVEFMMAEWYRVGFSFQQMVQETLDFLRLFLDKVPDLVEKMNYKELFLHYAGHYPESMEERDHLLAFKIEPQIGQKGFMVIEGFPPELAALAHVNAMGVAERFEIYYQGIELANGYHELKDAQEQRFRIEKENQKREQLGKARLPADEEFLQALAQGIPDCCGVAVGFDRLMLLRHQVEDIREISCFFQ